MGRSRGGLTTRIHAQVDAEGRSVDVVLTSGQTHDSQPAPARAGSTIGAGAGIEEGWVM